MAKYEDKRVLATNGKTYLVRAADYELAETLHEMWEDYTDDIEENALRIARHVEARAPEQGGEMREALKDWMRFSDDVRPSCAAGDDWLADLRARTRALLARESAEPAEERGPEVGDVVYIHWRNDHREVTTYSALLQAEVRGATVVVLMRRAEVEARIKDKSKEEER